MLLRISDSCGSVTHDLREQTREIQRFVFVAVRPTSRNRPVPHPTRYCPFAAPMCPERLRPSGRARAGHMGDDGAGVLLEMVPSATPPHARNAPSSRPKGDGDKRKALPYAQLLSQVLPRIARAVSAHIAGELWRLALPRPEGRPPGSQSSPDAGKDLRLRARSAGCAMDDDAQQGGARLTDEHGNQADRRRRRGGWRERSRATASPPALPQPLTSATRPCWPEFNWRRAR